ncbi:MAG TPA: hypothetical protein VFZ32_11950, partial [Micromonosporaceae bacterium]
MESHDEIAEVEARITGELTRLIEPGRMAGRPTLPPAYVRRHLVEHAAAGGVLDERILTADFLPFVDAGRLRALTAGDASAGDAGSLLRVWRRAAHTWSWESPAGNASALSVWAYAEQTPVAAARIPGVWEPRWGWWQTGTGEILGRHTGTVRAVAALVLPNDQPIAVTGSSDHTVRVWNLNT